MVSDGHLVVKQEAYIMFEPNEYPLQVCWVLSLFPFPQVFEAERMVTRIGSYHRNCFSCIECKRKLDSVTCCEGKYSE